jgi:hypothetical protein
MDTVITGASREHSMYLLLEECYSSGKTKKDFCTERGLSLHKFYYWRKKYKSSQAPTEERFIPVRIRQQANTIEAMKMHFPNGVILELPCGTSLVQLRAMISLV